MKGIQKEITIMRLFDDPHMLQLYETKYRQEVEKFGGEQLGRRRRDDAMRKSAHVKATWKDPGK